MLDYICIASYNGMKSWDEFFKGKEEYILLNEKLFSSKQTFSSGDIHIKKCEFKNCKRAIYHEDYSSNINCRMLVESSNFYSCNSDDYSGGGAICFTNLNSQGCVISKVCAKDCKTTTNGQFASINVKNSEEAINYVDYSTVTYCHNGEKFNTIYLINGKQMIQSLNSSSNKCAYQPGLYTKPQLSQDEALCIVKYSSFADNYASKFCLITFATDNAKTEMLYCNLIRFSQGNPNLEILQTNGDLCIYYTCILECNSGRCILEPLGGHLITITNCTVEGEVLDISDEKLKVISLPEKNFINALEHIKTGKCHSAYDSVGELTAEPTENNKEEKMKTIRYIGYGSVEYIITITSLFISIFIMY